MVFVHLLDGRSELGRDAIPFQYEHEHSMTYRVKGFHEVNESNIRSHVVLVAGMKSHVGDKLAIFAHYTQ